MPVCANCGKEMVQQGAEDTQRGRRYVYRCECGYIKITNKYHKSTPTGRQAAL